MTLTEDDEGKPILTWALAVLLAMAFLVAGIMKLLGTEMQVENFEAWGYPLWLLYAVGLFEVLMAIGLLFPSVTPYAATALIIEMVGAAYTHLARGTGEGAMVALNLVLIALLLVLAFLRRPGSLAKDVPTA